jgi:hypothetical protein
VPIDISIALRERLQDHPDRGAGQPIERQQIRRELQMVRTFVTTKTFERDH